MLRAKSAKGDYVTLASLRKREIEVIRRTEQFFCPECKEPVIIRAGPRVIPHFAHQTNSHCSKHEGGEGAYHQQGKLLLYDWLKKQNISTELEAYIPLINQRPDLLIRMKKRMIAIEYQCATIPLDLIKKRNIGYQQANIIPIWILGANQFKRMSNNRLQINAFTLQFLHQFSFQLPTTLFYFCPQQKTFSIINDVFMTTSNRAIANITFKSMKHLHFKDLFSCKTFSEEQLFKLWRKEKRKFRLSRTRAYGKELLWRKWIYEKNVHIEQLPSIVYLPVRSQHFMSVPPWNWQSRLVIDFLHPLQIGGMFSVEQVNQFLRRYQDLEDYLLLSNEGSPIQEYLSQLSQLKIIQPYAENKYIKCRSVQFYNNIEESLKGDDELLQRFMYNHYQERE